MRLVRLMALLACMATLVQAMADEPALPPGLGPAETPAVAAEADEPALPPGLGGVETGAAPGEPALPPGLGAPEPDGPALPPGLDGDPARPAVDEPVQARDWRDDIPLPVTGFWDARAGVRTQNDPAQSSDATLGELRLQLKTEKSIGNALLEFTGDFYADGVVDGLEFDLRRLRLTATPLPFMDLRLGRQILTWGTGDMLFINDLFPKDWQSYFAGRDVEYLKAPSDSVRVSLFHDLANLDIVYTPRFEPDRHISGERFSYWSPLRRRRAGSDEELRTTTPGSWFTNDEWHLRLYRRAGAAELALYGYEGYWKSPGGMRLITNQATFPRLRVIGASVRGPLWGGIANAEMGYYDSRDDRRGRDPFVNNSELRLLLGYERELARELTGAVQYYLEHMMDYGRYRDSLPFFMEPRDENRHVVTVRLTRLLMRQTLTLSLFAYYSPSDQDAYVRPRVSYKATDNLLLEAGGNVFIGRDEHTFFGQFEDNTNVYAAVRYSF